MHPCKNNSSKQFQPLNIEDIAVYDTLLLNIEAGFAEPTKVPLETVGRGFVGVMRKVGSKGKVLFVVMGQEDGMTVVREQWGELLVTRKRKLTYKNKNLLGSLYIEGFIGTVSLLLNQPLMQHHETH